MDSYEETNNCIVFLLVLNCKFSQHKDTNNFLLCNEFGEFVMQ